MAQSKWDEKCLVCKGSGKVSKEGEHGMQHEETCPVCGGSGERDPADVIRSLGGQYYANPLNVVGTYSMEVVLKAGEELIRQRDELKKARK